MKTTTYKKLLIVFIAMGSWLVTNSQQYPDSLSYYLELAAKNNPTILQKYTEYQASLQKVPQVGSLSDPELSLGVFLTPMELLSGNQVADIRLMQMFPWFGVLKSAKDEMGLMANAKFDLFRDARLQVIYDVQRTWFELYKVRKEINISEKNIEILKTIENLALVSFRTASSMQQISTGSASGNTRLTDIYRIQIEAGDLENDIALMQNRQNTIIAQFNSYLNRSLASPVFTIENLAPDSLGLSLVAVSDSMLANNPMLGMLKYEELSVAARKKMVSRMSYPMIGAGLNYSLINKNEMSTSSMNGRDMIMPMVTVTLPIYRKKYKAMQDEAELLKRASSQNYQSLSNSLQTEYYQAVQLFRDAQRRVKLYDNQYQLASKSLDLMLKSFTVSSSGLTDVLRIRQQTLDYELKQVEAVADFNTAIAWLIRLGDLEIN
ncbi:MAG: TolC family protein [Bacteroidota bacterium]